MKLLLSIPSSILILLMFGAFSLLAAEKEIKPADKNTSPEARALLKLLYDISGQYTLVGQHNYPNATDRNSQYAASYIGKTPVIFSTDMGFAQGGDKDS